MLIISLLMVLNSCSMLNISKLEDRNNLVSNNVIIPLWDSLGSNYNEEKSVIVLRVSKNENFEIRASILYKDDFRWYLSDKTDKIFGLMKYNNLPVLVFGDKSSCSGFFDKTGDFEEISYLSMRENKKANNPEVELEPDMFEPVVWYFSVKDGQFELLEKGMLPLLE